MKTKLTKLLLIPIILALALVACAGSGVTLADVVDQGRTDPRLYAETDFEPLISPVVPQLPTEVLYGMLRCAEGQAGTSVWRFMDEAIQIEYYIYIWDAGLAEGGFAYVNTAGGIMPNNGMNAPVFEIADLLSWMRADGWKEVEPANLPRALDAQSIQEAIRGLPASVPLWQAPANLFLMIFPGAMIYFQSPYETGGA